ncbi:hypothetical protein DTO012A8_8597 [Penicillium roqueforti]|nr:hypothetical protein DTO012A8_8597 [Penicillium roqueforti]
MAESSQSQPEQSVSGQDKPGPDRPPCQKRLQHDAYTIGWVCALPKEQTAARAMLDEEHEPLPIPRNDHNSYTLGSIRGHNVVIACLPSMGTNPAATVATSMINTFQSIRSDLHTDKIKRWLCAPDPSSNISHARTLRHEGTGEWLLESPGFQAWRSGSRRHLWLHGLAGCGKSVLSATVLDNLTNGNDGLILSFFFDFSDAAKQTLEGMLRSLAFQLYDSGLDSANHLDTSFQTHRDGSEQPTTKVLWGVVFKMLVAQKKVSIVLDALDESRTREAVLKWIKDMVLSPELVHVQLLLTGRPESEFLRDIPPLIGRQNCLPLDKQAVNSDIRSWVTAQLSQRSDFIQKPLSQKLLEEIRKKVGDGADGMFRWAFCQLDSLGQCPYEEAIEEALESLPQDLDKTYERMFESIPTKLKSDAIRLLQFLVHSKRPLTLAEVKEVIATKIENDSQGFYKKRRLFCENEILAYCPSLVTVVHTDVEELYLAHFSVKEYLLENDCFKTVAASISITRTCLAYAAEFWTCYATTAEAHEEILQIIADRSWDKSPGAPRGSRLYYACLGGLVEPIRNLVDKGVDVNAQGGMYGNALQAASEGGHQEIVKLLLTKGADVNAQGGDYSNALQAASHRGHQGIVKLLLNKGADVNAQSGDYSNALQAASNGGHQEIVKLLLTKGADVNAQGGMYGNALQAASFRGHQEIVDLLQRTGAITMPSP